MQKKLTTVNFTSPFQVPLAGCTLPVKRTGGEGEYTKAAKYVNPYKSGTGDKTASLEAKLLTAIMDRYQGIPADAKVQFKLGNIGVGFKDPADALKFANTLNKEDAFKGCELPVYQGVIKTEGDPIVKQGMKGLEYKQNHEMRTKIYEDEYFVVQIPPVLLEEFVTNLLEFNKKGRSKDKRLFKTANAIRDVGTLQSRKVHESRSDDGSFINTSPERGGTGIPGIVHFRNDQIVDPASVLTLAEIEAGLLAYTQVFGIPSGADAKGVVSEEVKVAVEVMTGATTVAKKRTFGSKRKEKATGGGVGENRYYTPEQAQDIFQLAGGLLMLKNLPDIDNREIGIDALSQPYGVAREGSQIVAGQMLKIVPFTSLEVGASPASELLASPALNPKSFGGASPSDSVVVTKGLRAAVEEGKDFTLGGRRKKPGSSDAVPAFDPAALVAALKAADREITGNPIDPDNFKQGSPGSRSEDGSPRSH